MRAEKSELVVTTTPRPALAGFLRSCWGENPEFGRADMTLLCRHSLAAISVRMIVMDTATTAAVVRACHKRF